MADRITARPTAEGKLYFVRGEDACSKRIVAYSMGSPMTADLAVRALRNALALRGPVDTVVHSDRGSQFRAHVYVRALRQANLSGSMSRVGACRGQRRDGVVLQLAAEERAGPAALAYP